MEVKIVKPQDFIETFEEFLDSEATNIMLRGYSDDTKIICLSEFVKSMRHGLNDIVIEVPNLKNAVNILPTCFKFGRHETNFKHYDHHPHFDKEYSVNGITYKFREYSNPNLVNIEEGQQDLVIFLSVQSILYTNQNGKMNSNFSAFERRIEAYGNEKKIFVTANDNNKSPENLYSLMDKVVILDTVKNEEVLLPNKKGETINLPY
ncbi:hypothetical protein CBF86_02840 [Limosilactobacillus reuteri]|uniref:hypothetical protein n=1 Tax=Limosilactobacillus reuteri TaxID=1598 RepID=UPI000B996B0B|nr:hypothetical protein [Limosilactobacillus reuteri]OYS49274.1 hypothetical protein CBF86_02840 [Limosilactobacillus reuteri]OYS50777.1 hypothetical protein CBF84_02170 [Limosilactobacillus reuteri]OYS55353.1 hypothetical protein CBF92_02275 [Limosilactobacillus reuteri]OYS56258.1 hypothetical protein CBF95_03575 [Limosilactobacillus reuteri]OYS63193.1 hypothetical protein CBF93_02160 [Limosilactobacillus reuteri]